MQVVLERASSPGGWVGRKDCRAAALLGKIPRMKLTFTLILALVIAGIGLASTFLLRSATITPEEKAEQDARIDGYVERLRAGFDGAVAESPELENLPEVLHNLSAGFHTAHAGINSFAVSMRALFGSVMILVATALFMVVRAEKGNREEGEAR